jgi:hypothetical protein
MAQGYQLIQSYTLASAASSITFSNIPQNFTDLKIYADGVQILSAVNPVGSYGLKDGRMDRRRPSTVWRTV